ncbi:unnamed protein product [Danaus chrysippus]|uniref:(African queen) hypothetical protein n=1 Tax=Danaus chrysippus TaxID=151541 RepID=A0A8J2VTG1_9NEOP|nr:unnamed protein product [Danaus chrysippus]
MESLIQNLVLLTLLFAKTDTARILAYFPTPSLSHQVVFRPITQELARRGHEVFVITADPAFPKNQTPPHLTEVDVHDISYPPWRKILQVNRGKKLTLSEQRLFVETFAEIFDAQMQLPEVKNLVNKDRNYYDLLLLESCNIIVFGVGHNFDAPIISLSSFGASSYQYYEMGAPTHPILYPSPERLRLYNLTLIEKVIAITWEIMKQSFYFKLDEMNAPVLRKHFGNDVPTVTELQKSVKMLFLNEHPIWSDNHPVPPNVIYMGGIHESPKKPLPQDLKDYLDKSSNGVIYFSFGTNALPSVLPPEKIKILTNVLSQLPYNVLWKWDGNTLPGQSKNIKTSKWFPQADLLKKYVYHKIGMQLDIESLNEDKLKQAIITIIEDESYKKNIRRLKELMRQYPIEPLNLTIWWIEHVIKYGGDHLQAPAAGLSWMEYYEIPLVLEMLSTCGWRDANCIKPIPLTCMVREIMNVSANQTEYWSEFYCATFIKLEV